MDLFDTFIFTAVPLLPSHAPPELLQHLIIQGAAGAGKESMNINDKNKY